MDDNIIYCLCVLSKTYPGLKFHMSFRVLGYTHWRVSQQQSQTQNPQNSRVIEMIIDTDLVDTTKVVDKIIPCHFIPWQAIVFALLNRLKSFHLKWTLIVVFWGQTVTFFDHVELQIVTSYESDVFKYIICLIWWLVNYETVCNEVIHNILLRFSFMKLWTPPFISRHDYR
jgi:hypothetical protein